MGWLAPLEPALWSEPWPALVAPCARREKLAWLEADLVARGRTRQQIATLPRQHTLPPLDSLAQRFGVAYVIEGAQLGGQVLLRTLAPRLAPRPTRFLVGYGTESGEKWRTFLSALGLSLCDPRERERAAESARLTFELAHGFFSARGIA